MLWSKKLEYQEEPFKTEAELEKAISTVQDKLFGERRVYLDVKKKVGVKGKTRNIPDGYLIDLSSAKQPKLYVVENELAAHDPMKHVAVQILEFSLSFESSPHVVKNILKEALTLDKSAIKKCKQYATANGYDNIDVLLERMIYVENSFNALVIIDELSEELEKVLISRFQFPVEILTLERYHSYHNEYLYRFQPFLSDVTSLGYSEKDKLSGSSLDPSDIDTIVVPAQEEGFQEVFLGENRWYAIRLHTSMIPKIKHIAVYQVAPESAITYIAPVGSIEQWKDTNKYVVNFSAPANEVKPIKLIPEGRVKAPQSPRYTSIARLQDAKSLEDAF